MSTDVVHWIKRFVNRDTARVSSAVSSMHYLSKLGMRPVLEASKKGTGLATRNSRTLKSVARYFSSAPEKKKGGSGIGNVDNKMLASTDEGLFKHCQYPRTASIIG